MSRLLTALLDSIIGDGCAACDMPGPPLCTRCRAGIPILGGSGCDGCGYPWPRPVPACPECIAGVVGARQAASSAGPVPTLVMAFKDHRRRALADPLAAVMRTVLAPPPPGAVLVPVPLTRSRLSDRGFNQAALLAGYLARSWGLPVHECLTRDDSAPSQRGSGARARRTQVRTAFHSFSGRPPLHAVLVDDVVTTGATLSAAARALRGAGCARVGAVALARVAPGASRSRVG
ncbi:MAG: phosphoribosyltransferase family protein [Miltoncostaeaceae bacterium]